MPATLEYPHQLPVTIRAIAHMPNGTTYTNHPLAHSNIHTYTALSHVTTVATMYTTQLPAALVYTNPSDPTNSHTSLNQ